MKKAILISMILCLISSFSGFAEENSEKRIIYREDEITDISQIQSRIDQGVGDYSPIEIGVASTLEILEQSGQQSSKNLDSDNDSLYIGEPQSTTQKLESSIIEGKMKETYVTTTAYRLNYGTGTESGSDGDSVTGAVLYITTKYEYTKDSLMLYGYFRFTEVKARVVRYDSSISFSNLVVRNNKMGDLYNDIYGNSLYHSRTDFNEIIVSSPSMNTFYSCNDKNTFVMLSGTGLFDGIASAYSSVTLRRGTSAWVITAFISKEVL